MSNVTIKNIGFGLHILYYAQDTYGPGIGSWRYVHIETIGM